MCTSMKCASFFVQKSAFLQNKHFCFDGGKILKRCIIFLYGYLYNRCTLKNHRHQLLITLITLAKSNSFLSISTYLLPSRMIPNFIS